MRSLALAHMRLVGRRRRGRRDGAAAGHPRRGPEAPPRLPAGGRLRADPSARAPRRLRRDRRAQHARLLPHAPARGGHVPHDRGPAVLPLRRGAPLQDHRPRARRRAGPGGRGNGLPAEQPLLSEPALRDHVPQHLVPPEHVLGSHSAALRPHSGRIVRQAGLDGNLAVGVLQGHRDVISGAPDRQQRSRVRDGPGHAAPRRQPPGGRPSGRPRQPPAAPPLL
mmetsp:Transcript_7759/g.20945  ORF Transcript_7759/g.20945 Transcript_7759/m.20945 type:complete len:223 (-) Transcript_7759:429-1097(-)